MRVMGGNVKLDRERDVSIHTQDTMASESSQTHDCPIEKFRVSSYSSRHRTGLFSRQLTYVVHHHVIPLGIVNDTSEVVNNRFGVYASRH
jgi:hypothetical protein